MKTLLRVGFTFLFFLLLFPSIAAAVQAWRSGLASLSPWQWPLLVLLPGLAWVWWRKYSVLGCTAPGATGAECSPGCRCKSP